MENGLAYWEKQQFFNFDVIVVGSGIVGLNAAISLKSRDPKLSVAVLERGFLPTGASTKNAGFACFGSISELIEQEKRCTTNGLHLLIEKRWKGLLKLRKLLGDDAIDFQNHGGYELFKPGENELAELCVAKISHYNTLINDIVKQEKVFRSANHRIRVFGLSKINTLIENKLEAQVDTGKMMRALLRKAGEEGVVIYNKCKVISLETENNSKVVHTEQGNFTGKKVLLCTNAFITELLPELDVVPGRGQVIITKPIPGLKIKGTFHYDKGYYYFRNIDNRVLLGGGRNLDFKTEETTKFGKTDLVQQALKNLLSEVILPDTAFEIDFTWSGIMAFGTAIEPIIKEVIPGVFCAVRCNGMGIAMGTQTGEDLADLVYPTL